MAFGSKNSTPSFVLTLPFDISLNEQDYLYKEFKKCGVIYNQLVSATTKMWHQLRKTRKYTHGKPHPWLFVGNRITRYLACCMVMSLAAAAQESHDFNRGRCQKLYGRPIQDVSRYETVINGLD